MGEIPTLDRSRQSRNAYFSLSYHGNLGDFYEEYDYQRQQCCRFGLG